MKTYKVKEIYYTLQGEGANVGRPAVFLRMSFCNLWSGYEKDRSKAICQFCDTDFVGTNGPNGGTYNADQLVNKVCEVWGYIDKPKDRGFVVCTGGEPLLQLDTDLIDLLHVCGFDVAVETNGTIQPPTGIDWLTVSPKANAKLVATRADELKLVYPQPALMPERLESFDATVKYLQPMDGPNQQANIQATVDYCLKHPQWRISFQSHKILNLP